jgi:NAD(P)-dependent dehydrogenase (short-subunit alcohol dehydrogenase family)
MTLSASLEGRHAVVTGAGQGIGAAVAMAFAACGAKVTLMGRRTEPLIATAARFPAKSCSHIVAVDVTQSGEVDAAFENARAQHGPVSILVNNAGQAESAAFANTSLELWDRMLAVNLTGTFLCSKAALPDLLLGRGRIVNVASTAAQRGYAYVSAYAAAKHGVLGLTRSLALELARTDVTVNAVCPGYTDTELLRASIANVVAKTGRTAQAARSEFEKNNPQNKLIEPAEVAATVLWLCSEGAASFTGQALSVSGGEVM